MGRNKIHHKIIYGSPYNSARFVIYLNDDHSLPKDAIQCILYIESQAFNHTPYFVEPASNEQMEMNQIPVIEDNSNDIQENTKEIPNFPVSQDNNEDAFQDPYSEDYFNDFLF
jgi:hypothetical protein